MTDKAHGKSNNGLGKAGAAIYCRTANNESFDLTAQEQEARLFAEARGWTIVDVFKDACVSGLSERREGLQTMIDQALQKEPPFRFVLVHSSSRISRNLFHYAKIQSDFHRNGVEIVSVQDRTFPRIAQFDRDAAASIFDEYHSRRTSIDERDGLGSRRGPDQGL